MDGTDLGQFRHALPASGGIAPQTEESVDRDPDELALVEATRALNIGDGEETLSKTAKDGPVIQFKKEVPTWKLTDAAQQLKEVVDLDGRVSRALCALQYADDITEEEIVETFNQLVEAKDKLSAITPLLEALVEEIDTVGLSETSPEVELVATTMDPAGKGKGKASPLSFSSKSGSGIKVAEVHQRLAEIIDEDTVAFFKYLEDSEIIPPKKTAAAPTPAEIESLQALLLRQRIVTFYEAVEGINARKRELLDIFKSMKSDGVTVPAQLEKRAQCVLSDTRPIAMIELPPMPPQSATSEELGAFLMSLASMLEAQNLSPISENEGLHERPSPQAGSSSGRIGTVGVIGQEKLENPGNSDCEKYLRGSRRLNVILEDDEYDFYKMLGSD